MFDKNTIFWNYRSYFAGYVELDSAVVDVSLIDTQKVTAMVPHRVKADDE